MTNVGFSKRVFAVVGSIPKGRLMTYGQIAALCGSPRAARQVGQIAHFGPTDLPWHRVVNREGGLARGWPGGIGIQKQLLEQENVDVSTTFKVKLSDLQWWPN